jgi:hypothetical protein
MVPSSLPLRIQSIKKNLAASAAIRDFFFSFFLCNLGLNFFLLRSRFIRRLAAGKGSRRDGHQYDRCNHGTNMSIIRPSPTLSEEEKAAYYSYKDIAPRQPVPFVLCRCLSPVPVIKRMRKDGTSHFYGCGNWGKTGDDCKCFLSDTQIDELIADVDGKASKKKATVRFFFDPNSVFYAKINHIDPIVALQQSASMQIDDFIGDVDAEGSPSTQPVLGPINTTPYMSTTEPFPRVVLSEDSNGGSLTKPSVFVFPPTDTERRAMVWIANLVRAAHAQMGLEGNQVCPVVFTPSVGGVSVDTSASAGEMERLWNEYKVKSSPSIIEWAPPVVKEGLYYDFQMRLGGIVGGSRICRFKVVDTALPDDEVSIMIHHFPKDLDGWLFGSADFLLVPKPRVNEDGTARLSDADVGNWLVVDKERLRSVIHEMRLHEMTLEMRPANAKCLHAMEFLENPARAAMSSSFSVPKSEMTANHSFSHAKLKHPSETIGSGGGKCDSANCGLCAPTVPMNIQAMKLNFDSSAPANKLCSLVNVSNGARDDRSLVFQFAHFERFCADRKLLVELKVDEDGRLVFA